MSTENTIQQETLTREQAEAEGALSELSKGQLILIFHALWYQLRDNLTLSKPLLPFYRPSAEDKALRLLASKDRELETLRQLIADKDREISMLKARPKP